MHGAVKWSFVGMPSPVTRFTIREKGLALKGSVLQSIWSYIGNRRGIVLLNEKQNKVLRVLKASQGMTLDQVAEVTGYSLTESASILVELLRRGMVTMPTFYKAADDA